MRLNEKPCSNWRYNTQNLNFNPKRNIRILLRVCVIENKNVQKLLYANMPNLLVYWISDLFIISYLNDISHPKW